ncbi:hypothetical protein ACHAWF_011661 [Thalassiosira exigua]
MWAVVAVAKAVQEPPPSIVGGDTLGGDEVVHPIRGPLVGENDGMSCGNGRMPVEVVGGGAAGW